MGRAGLRKALERAELAEQEKEKVWERAEVKNSAPQQGKLEVRLLLHRVLPCVAHLVSEPGRSLLRRFQDQFSTGDRRVRWKQEAVAARI